MYNDNKGSFFIDISCIKEIDSDIVGLPRMGYKASWTMAVKNL